MKRKLSELVIDPVIQVREVEPYTVSRYAQAMKAGARFPAITIDQNNRVICGNHRHAAYRTAFDPDYSVSVEMMNFDTDEDVIRYAARDNVTHGRPLDTWDMKRVALRLKNAGDSPDAIAELLSIPVKKVESWAGIIVVTRGVGKKVLREQHPVKHGLEHMQGREIDSKVYESHKRSDLGVPVKNMAAIITRHVSEGLIDTEDEKTMHNLANLHTALNDFLKE